MTKDAHDGPPGLLEAGLKENPSYFYNESTMLADRECSSKIALRQSSAGENVRESSPSIRVLGENHA